MALREDVQSLRKEVADFREAFDVLQNPPQRYGPQVGELPILDFLKLQVSLAKSDQEREELLKMSQQALADAERRLLAKEQQLASLESDCEAIANEMCAAGRRLQEAEFVYREALADFEALATRHQGRWQQLNPNQELFSRLGRTEFPAFILTAGCLGILTTPDIARDLKR